MFRERRADALPVMLCSRKLVLSNSPMPFETLGGNAGADSAAEGHPLGQAAVVPVQQRRRVGMPGVDFCRNLEWSWLKLLTLDNSLLVGGSGA